MSIQTVDQFQTVIEHNLTRGFRSAVHGEYSDAIDRIREVEAQCVTLRLKLEALLKAQLDTP